MLLPFALWGTAMAAMKPLLQEISPLTLAWLRILPAAVILLLAARLLQRPLLQMPLPEVPGDELAAVRRVQLGRNSIDIYNLG